MHTPAVTTVSVSPACSLSGALLCFRMALRSWLACWWWWIWEVRPHLSLGPMSTSHQLHSLVDWPMISFYPFGHCRDRMKFVFLDIASLNYSVLFGTRVANVLLHRLTFCTWMMTISNSECGFSEGVSSWPCCSVALAAPKWASQSSSSHQVGWIHSTRGCWESVPQPNVVWWFVHSLSRCCWTF